jgi:NCS1 family nucleobase:cation symporter-1
MLSSFSVFLAPRMGVMVCDYFFVRHQKTRLNHHYRPEGSGYWSSHGLNWRVIACWISGWALTIGGLIVSASAMTGASGTLFQLYFTAFFTGLSIPFTTLDAVNYFFPIVGVGNFDEYDD